ncbi:unnamed protein product, partial [Urochloa humidicola]
VHATFWYPSIYKRRWLAYLAPPLPQSRSLAFPHLPPSSPRRPPARVSGPRSASSAMSKQGGKAKPLKAPKVDKKEYDESDLAYLQKKKDEEKRH